MDLVEYFLKDKSVKSYISIYAPFFIYLAFQNVEKYRNLIKYYLKKKPTVTLQEAHLLANYLVFDKFSVERTMWRV